MKKRSIVFIIVLAALSIFGLIVLQYHWIRTGIETRQMNFEDSVDDAMSSIILEVEKQQVVRRLQDHFHSAPDISALLDTLYVLNRVLSDTAVDSSSEREAPSMYSPGRFGGEYSFDESLTNKEDLQLLLQRSVVLTNLFLDLMGPDQTGADPVHEATGYLDSLIRKHLGKKGLETPFVFGIISPPYQTISYISRENYNKQIKESSFSYDLYPRDIFREPVYLNIYFPKSLSYLLSRMAGMLVLSVVLIIILVYAFYYTVHTIFRQKRLSEMKNDFINNMTHEFKTPVSTISLACQTLCDEDIPRNQELYDNYISIINEENNRLGSMAEKILQTAIIDKQALGLNPEVINMHHVINNAISKIKIQIEQKNGTINTALDAGNPMIKADKFHMTSVVFNLLDNANKYSFNRPEITIQTRNKPSGLQVIVSDNGIGISKASQKKIFEKLYRVPTGDLHNTKGFGLGLSYVKAIVEKHNGRIQVQSEVNKGATFILYIPFKPQDNHE